MLKICFDKVLMDPYDDEIKVLNLLIFYILSIRIIEI